MIFGLFRKNTGGEPVYAVYRAIVAQSRQPRFYAEWGVPDTVTGRFDMISLHLVLLFRRLRAEGAAADAFNQKLFDLFFKDMDRSLREMGVSDLGIPKKVRKMTTVFYGLLGALNPPLDSRDTATLEAVLKRNLFTEAPDASPALLAAYLLEEETRLKAQPATDILGGALALGEAA